MQSAATLGRSYIGTEHMLVGLLRHIGSRAYPILRRMGVNYDEVLGAIKTMPSEITAPMPVVQPVPPGERLSLVQIFMKISPVFWGLAVLMGLSGAALFNGWLPTGVAVFLFVTVGWVVSLSLHEFGHALTAYLGGDFTVVDKGYLTLNPLHYTHAALSILFPLIYLALGGIGLPGGAVYINYTLIPSKRMRSLVAAAGPIMTGLFSLLVVAPFFLGMDQKLLAAHQDFLAGLTFLAFLQITTLIFNLIPLPPLDGFGILRPFLPPSLVRQVYAMGRWTFFFIFIIFIVPNPLQIAFWQLIGIAIRILNLDPQLISVGWSLYRFWG
jgi:Zn-dependent protease